MDKEFLHFEKLIGKRGKFAPQNHPPLSQTELNSIKSLTTASTSKMYVTSTCLWQTWLESTSVPKKIWPSQRYFSPKTSERQPFIIGVSGSVAVGKSTTSTSPSNPAVTDLRRLERRLVTTDGFLYPNAILKNKRSSIEKDFQKAMIWNCSLIFLIKSKTTRA